ncbi:MAG: flagellar biosynthesis protein FlgA [Oscillochloris sp.]|nr:flagellar biosynthesis protein FlgA [Oscillochloris sp.]
MTTTTPVIPLGQALTRSRRNPLPFILLAVGLVSALSLAILGFLESRKTEGVLVLARDVPYGQPITAADLGRVELPLHRPVQLAGIADPAQVIGQYAARQLANNDLLQPSMLMAAPPNQPIYPNGEQLAPNMVPVPFATTSIGPLSFHDRVNIGFNDPSGTATRCGGQSQAPGQPYACRLLSNVRVLYVDEGAQSAYLELTPYQAQAIWAIQAAGLPLWGERYGTTSEVLPALERLDLSQLTPGDLEAPAAGRPAPNP